MKKILVAVLCTLFLAGCASEPMKNESDYAVLYFQTNYDDSLTIDTPLESDK